LDSFKNFAKTFDVGAKTATISQLLRDDIELTKFHAELVPDLVPYQLFWQRFFFWRAQIVITGEKQKLALGLDEEEEEEDLGWDQEDEDIGGLSAQPTMVTIASSQPQSAVDQPTALESFESVAAVNSENELLKTKLRAECEKSCQLEEKFAQSKATLLLEIGRLESALTAEAEKTNLITEQNMSLNGKLKELEGMLAAAQETERRLLEDIGSIQPQCTHETSKRLAAEEVLPAVVVPQTCSAESESFIVADEVKCTIPSEGSGGDDAADSLVLVTPGLAPEPTSPIKDEGTDPEWDDWG